MKSLTLPLLLRASPLAALSLFTGFGLPLPSVPAAVVEEGAAEQIYFDIKPGSCPNPVNVNYPDGNSELINGFMVSVVPMSILGDKFEVDQVDLGSVGVSMESSDGELTVYPIQFNFSDTGTPFVGEGCECHAEGGDETVDLDLKFDKQELIDTFGLQKMEDGAFVELKIHGTTGEGRVEFVGRDCIRIINHL